MNPLTNVRNIQNLNKRELELGVTFSQSWHQQYRDSAWIFIGGLDYDLTEGDIICLFSQYGEVVNINLVRDQKTGKSKGFAFLCYENQLSTVLSVDNLNSIKLCGRTIRVDHVEEYKVPKMKEDMAPEKIKLALEGCAPQLQMSSQAAAAGGRSTKLPSIKREQHAGYNDANGQASSARTSEVKSEPLQQTDDIDLPPRLFDVGVKENGAASKKNKGKKKKSKKSKKKSKSKKSKKSKHSDPSSSSSDSEDGSESDSLHKYSGHDGSSKQKRPEGGRKQTGESSSSRDRTTDLCSANTWDTITVKNEPRDRGASSRREGLPGGNEHRGTAESDWGNRIKEEPVSDDNDGFSGRESGRGHDRETGGLGRNGNSRNDRDDYRRVNGDRKRKWEEEDNGSRRKGDDRHSNTNDSFRRSATSDRSYKNSSRDTSSSRGYGRDYDNARR